MHQSNNKIYLENLRIEIETFQWVLTQILRLLQMIIINIKRITRHFGSNYRLKLLIFSKVMIRSLA